MELLPPINFQNNRPGSKQLNLRRSNSGSRHDHLPGAFMDSKVRDFFHRKVKHNHQLCHTIIGRALTYAHDNVTNQEANKVEAYYYNTYMPEQRLKGAKKKSDKENQKTPENLKKRIHRERSKLDTIRSRGKRLSQKHIINCLEKNLEKKL